MQGGATDGASREGGGRGEAVDWVDANIGLPPEAFYDPISGGVLEDPVVAEDGQCYSRASIQAMFERDRREGRASVSPVTGEPMGVRLEPNAALAADLEAFRLAHGRAPPAPVGEEEEEGADEPPSAPSGIKSLRDLRLIFTRLDRLRDILATTLEGWQPPQLVVLGGESSGKSTLLARLTMMPLFPAHDNLCTRLPIHVRLRHCSALKPPRLEVRNAQTGACLEGPWEVPMGSGSRTILSKMEELVWSEENQRLGVHTGRMLVVHVDSPAVPSLDLVDLPGLVHSPEQMAAATDELVRRYIQQHDVYSIFLVTVPAVHKPNDSKALALAHQLGIQDRTIGVMTMCDELPKRRHAQLRERLERPPEHCSESELNAWLTEPLPGDSVRLRNGYVATVNEPLDAGSSDSGKHNGTQYDILNEQARRELTWFQANDLGDLIETGQATCNKLVDRINTLFVEYMRETWVPVTIFKLNQERLQLQFLDACLGLPTADPQAHRDPSLAERIRELAVKQAALALEGALPQILQAFSRMLSDLRRKLMELVPSELVILPEQMETNWFSLTDAVMAACATACQEQESFWEKEIRAVLSHRQEQPAWPSLKGAKAISNATFFQLSRFPAFIEAIMQHLRRLLRGEQRESIEAALDTFLGRFFDELLPQPCVSIRPILSGAKATVSIQCKSEILADTVALVFLRHGIALMEKGLMPSLEEISSNVSDWHEACTAERDALRIRLLDVQNATSAVRKLADATLSMERDEPSPEPVTLRTKDLLDVSMAYTSAGGAVVESRSLVIGEGSEPAIQIVARDAEGNILKGGHLPFKVTLYSSDASTSQTKHADGWDNTPLCSATAHHSGDGVYEAKAPMPNIDVLGQDASASLSIELYGSHVAGSPFPITLTSVSPSRCRLSGDGLTMTEPGKPSSIEILAYMRDGRTLLPRSDLPLMLELHAMEPQTGPGLQSEDSRAILYDWESSCTGEGGRYSARYTIDGNERLDAVLLRVSLYGRDVPGSPFNVHLKQKPMHILPGVVHNFPKSRLSDWALFYDEPYTHATMISAFPTSGEWLFVCASLEGSDAAALGAFGERDVVTKDNTGDDMSGFPHHGAFWYWRPNRSVGFSSIKRISLNHADTCTEAAEDRLSWHFQQSGNGGWRVGAATGLEKECGQWRKQIYVWPASAAEKAKTSSAESPSRAPRPY